MFIIVKYSALLLHKWRFSMLVFEHQNHSAKPKLKTFMIWCENSGFGNRNGILECGTVNQLSRNKCYFPLLQAMIQYAKT